MADIEGTDPISGAADETATRHQLTGLIGRSAPLPIWAHLDAMKDWLARARQAATQADQRGSAAAEWLLDNDYQIQRAILQIGEGLPKAFYARPSSRAVSASGVSPASLAVLGCRIRRSISE
jgi:cyclic beta-1,2-glucan synthetase